MVRPVVAVALVLALSSCGGPRAAPPSPIHRDARIAIARAEAKRGEGVEELVRWADDADAEVRRLALRGLARVGDPAAIEVLRTRVRHGRDGVPAAEALGLVGAFAPPGTLAKPSLIEGAPAITGELVELVARTDGAERARVLEAIGRVGDASALPTLASEIRDGDREAAMAAAIALGRFGRRAISLDAAAAKAAAVRMGEADRDVRYAMTYGLARAGAPGKGDEADKTLIEALATRLVDDDPEIRATALLGLTRHEARAAAGERARQLLQDDDWRVAVEAVRMLTGAQASAEDRAAVAATAVRDWALIRDKSARTGTIHVVIEALHALAPHYAEVRAALDPIQVDEATLDARHVSAHLLAGKAFAGDDAALARLDGLRGLPDGLLGGVVAEVLAARNEAGIAPLIERARAGSTARRAAALGVIAGTWAKASAEQRAAIVEAITAAIGDANLELSGTAADAGATILGTLATDQTEAAAAPRAALERAIVDRIAGAVADPELASSLLSAAGTAKIAAARDACTKAHGSANPAVRLAARGCLEELTGTDPGPGAATPLATPDGVDPSTVVGAEVRWTVATSRGTLVIALDSDAAPWHVATFATLVQRGFYDGLLFHRVVADFVVQGGDPDGTGWGGPGFTLPAEPSTARYDRGAVGVADAGKDTGGSQWFTMHARMPHLEGRYTSIGKVIEGAEHIDELLIGDTIVKSTIAINP